jgi:ribosomal protein S2
MAPFISVKRKCIHIINLAQTAHFSSELVISFSMQQVEENSS